MIYSSNNMATGVNNALGYTMSQGLNYAVLNKLGFTNEDISDVCNAFEAFGKADKKQIVESIRYSGSIEHTDGIRLSKLMYLARVIESKTVKTSVLQSIDTLIKNKVCETNNIEVENAMTIVAMHYSKMFRNFRVGSDKFTNRGIGTPSIKVLKSLALVANINDPIFEIYNSNRYIVKERFYTVIKKGASNTTLITTRTPVLSRGQEPKVADVGEIKEAVNKLGEKQYNLILNNKYVGVLNRFVIVASTRRPQSHCGMVEMVCKGGTKLYVYAIEWNTSDSVNGGVNYKNDGAGSNSAKIFDYGFNASELEDKLITVTNSIYNKFDGIIKILVKPEHKFISKAFKVKSYAEKIEEQIKEAENKY